MKHLKLGQFDLRFVNVRDSPQWPIKGLVPPFSSANLTYDQIWYKLFKFKFKFKLNELNLN